jgi:hypothetical protein
VTPTEWIESALSPTDPQTATEIADRIPWSLTQTVVLLHALVDADKAERHEPAEGQSEATYTRKVST